MSERLEAKVMLSAVVAYDDSFGTLHDFPLEGVDVIGNDIDNSPFMEGLTASLISDVSHGTLSLDPSGTFEYTPSGTYVGVDTFVYEASNSYGSDQATVTINVGNIAPVADDLTFDVPHSTALSDVAVTATDENGGTHTFSLDGGVSAGSLLFHGDGSFQYTPPVGFVTTPGNPVTFDYIVDDGFDTDTGTVSINVYNVAPEAMADGPYSTLETFTLTVDAAEGLLANDSDFDGSTLDLIVSYYTQPENGAVSVNPDGSFEYTPDADFVGSDSFEYRVQDPQGAESELALVQLASGTIKLERHSGNPFDTDWHDPAAWGATTLVGEGITLRATVVGVEPPEDLTYQWTIPSEAVAGYEVVHQIVAPPQTSTGHVIPLIPDHLDDSSVHFYWVDGGAKNVTVTVANNDGTLTKDVTVQVERPDTVFSAVTTTTSLKDDPQKGGWVVRFGDFVSTPIKKGIVFNSSPALDSAGNPIDIDGSLHLTQLGNSEIHFEDGNGLWMIVGQGLDNSPALPSPEDSPFTLLDPGWSFLTRQESFTTYQMYTPDRGDAISVPLKKMKWFWNVELVNGGGWQLVQHEGGVQSIEDTTEFPEWGHRLQDIIQVQEEG